MRQKKQYLIGIDYTVEEQKRLQKFAALQPEKSVRAFVKQAIINEITYRLEEMEEAERVAVTKIIKR